MRLKKLILPILLLSVSACATVRPARIVNTTTLGFPEYKSYNYSGGDYRPGFRMQFSSNDEIMLSFFNAIRNLCRWTMPPKKHPEYLLLY
jgi:hypothetical protein